MEYTELDIRLRDTNPFSEIIIANINRNIILRDLPIYYKSLSLNGDLLISGFLFDDVNLILRDAKKIGFNLINKKTKINGICFT
jgi:ribosomal protein L11 methyltransferase|tara:strand:- start:5338 stop:5589 length:252 start_codon:yes stop_codon:yes gene_type:complete